MSIDEGREGGDGDEGGVHFGILFFEHDAEVFVEKDGDFEDVDRIEAEAFFSEDGGFGGDGLRALEFQAAGEDFDEVLFRWGHARGLPK